MKKAKAYEEVLVHFDNVLKKSVIGRKYTEFTTMHSIMDFSDGFIINEGHCNGANVMLYLVCCSATSA